MSDLRTRLRLEGDATSLVAAGAASEQALRGVQQAASSAGGALRTAGAAAQGSGAANGAAAQGAAQLGRGLQDVQNRAAAAGAALQGNGAATRTAGQAAAAAAQQGASLDRELGQVAVQAPLAGAGLTRTARGAHEASEAADLGTTAMRALSAAMAYVGARELISGIEEAAMAQYRLEAGLRASTGGGRAQAETLAFVRQEADRLGLSTDTTARDLMGLTTATRSTRLEGEATRTMFMAASEAGVAYGRSNQEISAGIAAFGQIAGRSRVTLADLNGELRTVAPDALNVASRAMGVTTAQLTTMLQRGKVATDDFLPKFAAQLRRDVGPALDEALSSPVGRARVELQQLHTTIDEVQATAGQAFLGGVVDGLGRLNGELGSGDVSRRAAEWGGALGRAFGAAADGASFLVRHIDDVILAGETLAGIALVQFLASTVVATRNATIAAANLAVVESEEAAAAEAAAVAQGNHYRAASTLVQALTNAERYEVALATSALREAEAQEAAAAAAAAHARATAVLLTEQAAAVRAEEVLTVAKLESAAASDRLAIANARLAAAQSGLGVASRGAGAAMSGLLGLVGGPWGAALIGAGVAVAYVADQIADEDRQIQAATDSHQRYQSTLAEVSSILHDAGVQTTAWGGATAGAVSPTDQLAGSTRDLADQTFRLADARRQAAMMAIQAQLADLARQDESAATHERWTRAALDPRAPISGIFNLAPGLMDLFPGTTPRVQVGVHADGTPIYRRATDEEGYADREAQRRALMQTGNTLINAPPGSTAATTQNDRRDARPPRDGRSSGSQSHQAEDELHKLQVEAQGLREHSQAATEGWQALERWRVAEAGRQAVLQAGHHATEAQTAAIRAQAEEVERLRIADERITRARESSRTDERQITALRARAVAAHGTEEDLEELARTEAATQAVQALGVDSLDDLTGAQREAAQAAYDSAQALEGQRQATDRATRAGAAERDLRQRIALEQAHAQAIGGVTRAAAEWQRSEFVRQEVERAGLRVTDAAARGIIAEAEALYSLQAANQGRTEHQQLEDELAMLRLTTREREIQQRMLAEKSRLLAEHKELSEAEAEVLARQTAEIEQQARESAETIGQLRESTRQAFIDSGSIESFGASLQDTVTKRLRAAFYDAYLARPLEIIINATVHGLDGIGGAGGAGAGGLGNLGGLNIPGLGSLSGVLGMAGQAYALIQAASSIGGSLASFLGGDKKTGSIAGGLLGGIPGGLIGAFVHDEGERPQAQSDIVIRDGQFVLSGSRTGDGGDAKAMDDLAKSVIDQLNKAAQTLGLDLTKAGDLYAALGVVKGKDTEKLGQGFYGGTSNESGTLSGLHESTWDAGFHSGFSITGAQDAQTLAASVVKETILRAIAAGAGQFSDAERKIIESTADLEDAIAKIQLGRTLVQQIDDAILQLTDPAAYEKKKALDAIDASYQAMKAQAEQLVAAGLVSGDILTKLDHLKDLQVEDALKKLAGSAEGAAEALAAARPRLQDWLDRAVLGDASPVAPDQKRDAAMDQYQRQLGLAKGGDADALGSITEYADRLLSADREANVDAQARRALFDQVMADIAALAAPAKPVDPVVVIITDLRDQITAQAQALYDLLQSTGGTTIAHLSDLLATTPEGLEAVRVALGLNRAATREDAELVISSIDTNKDGVISALELSKAASVLGLGSIVTALQLGQDATTDLLTGVVDGLTQVTGVVTTNTGGVLDLGDIWVTGLTVRNFPNWHTVFGEPLIAQQDSIVGALDALRLDVGGRFTSLQDATVGGLGDLMGVVNDGLTAVHDSVLVGNGLTDGLLSESKANNSFLQQTVSRL